MSQDVVKKDEQTALASADVLERMAEIKDNLESIENFKLPRAKMTPEGFELVDGEKPVMSLDGVIIHTKKTNVYYAKAYNRDNVLPPDCFSLDGNTPDKSISNPVSESCRGCPMAEFGTNSMKSGKACRNLKPLYMLLSDEAIMPRQIVVTPASLKAANEYLLNLTERGIPYKKIKTKITCYKDNPKDTYVKLRFQAGAKLNEVQAKNVEFLKEQWLKVMSIQSVDESEFVGEASPTTSDVGF